MPSSQNQIHYYVETKLKTFSFQMHCKTHKVFTIYCKILQPKVNNRTLIAHAIKIKEDDACKPTSLGYEY
jgi:hypothetical protein